MSYYRTWNLRGKSIEDVSRCWDLLGGEGIDVFALQEVGGLKELALSGWDQDEMRLGSVSYVTFMSFPLKSFHGTVIGLPLESLSQVVEVKPLLTGLAVTTQSGGQKEFVISLHLPHRQRQDCVQVWHEQLDELRELLQGCRYMDRINILADLNLDLMSLHPNENDERRILLEGLMAEFALDRTHPHKPTWKNSRGSNSRIDYLLFSTGTRQAVWSEVLEDSDVVLGTDHRCCTLALQALRKSAKNRALGYSNSHRCGKWRVDVTGVPTLCENLHAQLQALDLPLTDSTIQGLAEQACTRPGSLRYKDSADIKALISLRRRQTGTQARETARKIVVARALAKKAWMTSLLDRGATGDYHAVSFFKRRQSTRFSQGSFIMRAGGQEKAARAMRNFYKAKYTPPDPHCAQDTMDAYLGLVGCVPNAPSITPEEIQDVLDTTKAGKSTGQDGVPYELVYSVMQSTLQTEFVSFFNSVLHQISPIPARWLRSQVALIPKVKRPSKPEDLRPIVLSSTPGKLFTKVLLLRLRRIFPPMHSHQLSGLPGAQSLDGSLTLQHVVRQSQQWKLQLYAAKLDISQAFDTLSHAATARFLASLGPSREAYILLLIICNSIACMSLGSESWEQPLRCGLKQGSSYSAELFARVLDHFVSHLFHKWRERYPTWIQDEQGTSLHAILYADDVVLLASSREHMLGMLQELKSTLAAIGLHLALDKCFFICSPGLDTSPLILPGVDSTLAIKHSEAFIYLGILVGFGVSCGTALSRRLAAATGAFWGHSGFLCRGNAPLKKRLQLFDAYVTNKWKWASAAFRPVADVRRLLDVLQTSLLASMLRPAYDGLQDKLHNWVCRRRADRMAAQACSHVRWAIGHAQCFLRYWGHAARYTEFDWRPITKVLRFRDHDWLLQNQTLRRARGFWPDAIRWIQLQWESVERLGNWIPQAQNREHWKLFIHDWIQATFPHSTGWYPRLEFVELLGRSLLHVGDRFWLLPLRHPPVEEPYEVAYQHVPGPEAEMNQGVFRVSSDGSSSDYVGGAGITVLPPYGRIPDDLVLFSLPIANRCTNIRAELIAAARALQVCARLQQDFPGHAIELHCDSLHVLHVISDAIVTTANLAEVCQLKQNWKRVKDFVIPLHVRAHKGDPLNELADAAAKRAVNMPLGRMLVRSWDFVLSRFVGVSEACPSLRPWW